MTITWTSAGSWLLHSVVGGGLVLLVACVLVRCTRQPARRQRLGEFGLAAALTVALLSLAPAWVLLPWPADNPMAAAPAGPPLPAQEPIALDGFAELPLAPWQQPDAEDAPVQIVAAAEPTPSLPLEDAVAPVDWREAVAACAVGLFALGAGWTLSRWAFGWTVLTALVRKARPAPWEIAALFAAMAPAHLRARLRVSGRLRVPVSCGLVRPTVLVPSSFCGESQQRRLRWIFAHELTHLERRDAWSCLLFGLGQALFFALPWFWWLRRQVRLCQEYVADAAAIAALGESGHEAPADYAEFLLSLTETPAVPLATTGVSGNPSDLYRRVLMLLEQPLPVERRCPRPWAWLTAAGLLALGVLVSGVGLRADAAPVTDAAIADGGGADDGAKQKQVGKNIRVIVVPGDAKAHGVIVQFDGDKTVGRTVSRAQREAHRAVVIGQHDAETVRKALEKLEKDGQIKREQVQEILKALEKAAKLRVEVRTERKTAELPKEVQESLRKLQEQIEKAGGKFDADAVRKQIEKALQKTPMAIPQIPAIPQLPHVPPAGLGAFPPALPMQGAAPGMSGMFRFGGGGRLGVRVEKPSAALVDQLNLTKGQGLVIVDVQAGSAAAKADLRVNDILLKLGDKTLSSEPGELAKTVDGLKANSTVTATVLRKGQQVTAKVTVPESKGRSGEFSRLGFGFSGFGAGPGSIVTTITRTGDNFTARHQEGDVIINMTGTIADGKAKPATINIQSGGKSQRFDSVDAVPEMYRDRVNQLLRNAAGNIRVEAK